MNYYLIIFFGALFAGESFLAPGIYMVSRGMVTYQEYQVFGILGTMVADSLWYLLGRSFSLKKIKSLPVLKKKKETIDRIYDIFKKHGLKILIFSKFVYGTRIIAQMLCGTTKIKYWKYLLVNSFAVFLWINAIFITYFLTEKGFSILDIKYSKEISLALIIILVTIIYIWTKKKIQKKWKIL